MSIYGNMFESLRRVEEASTVDNHMEAYIEANFLSLYNEEYFDESVVLQEIRGSESRNEELKEIINGMDKALIFFMKRIEIMADGIDEAMKMANKINKSNVSKQITAINHKLEDYKRKLNKLENDYVPTGAIHKLKGICKKFSVKYGDISLEEKKAFEKKIIKYNEDLQQYFKRFGAKSSNFTERLQKICSNVEDMSTMQNGKGLYDLLVGWAKEVIEETYATCNDINYIVSTFNIRKIESSLLYKILSKFGNKS